MHLHTTSKHMFIGSKLPSLSEQILHCIAAIMCNPPSRDCCSNKCAQCPRTENLQEWLQKNLIDNIQYQQWMQTD